MILKNTLILLIYNTVCIFNLSWPKSLLLTKTLNANNTEHLIWTFQKLDKQTCIAASMFQNDRDKSIFEHNVEIGITILVQR